MEPTPELIDALYMDKIHRARLMRPVDKLLAGPRLFEFARTIAMAGIRARHPNAGEDQLRELFQKHLRLSRQMERTP